MISHIHPLALLDVGGGEIAMIFIVVLMLFGGQKLPELARGLGKSIREFKKATSGIEDEIKRAMEEDTTPKIQAPKTPWPVNPPIQSDIAALNTPAEGHVAPPHELPPYDGPGHDDPGHDTTGPSEPAKP